MYKIKLKEDDQMSDPRITLDRQLYEQVSLMAGDYGLSVPKLVDMQLREFLQTGKLPAFKTNYSDVMFGMLNNKDTQLKYYLQQHRDQDQLIKRMLSTLLEQIRGTSSEYAAWIELVQMFVKDGEFNFKTVAHDEHMLHDVRQAIDETYQFVSSWTHVLAQHHQKDVDKFVKLMDEIHTLNYNVVFKTDLDKFYWYRIVNELLAAIDDVLTTCGIDGEDINTDLHRELDFDWLRQILESILKIIMPYDFSKIDVDWLDGLQHLVQLYLDNGEYDEPLRDWVNGVVYQI